MSRAGSVLAAVALVVALAACDPLGLPATRALENGAESMLTRSSTFEFAGPMVESGTAWMIDVQIARPLMKHMVVSSQGEKVEAVIIGPDAYFRGQQFLAKHLAGNPLGPSLAKAAGNSWWKDAAGLVPNLPELTDGAAFRATFLGSAVGQRTDHQPVDGVDAVELSGVRADVYIASAPPYHLLRVHLKDGVVIDGISGADLKYSNVDRDFKIAAPSDVIDFANLSTLPPIYTVVSVDTSGCGSPCVVSAKLRNLGGATAALAPSTITFTMADSANGQVLGTCQAKVQPDVGYNATTTVSCTIAGSATNAAVVTATADNPGRGVT
ncbi:MAG TPA: hypothetical protein VKF28_06735 [Candidatus Dormibacteraeota bacterium]|nr:hypothetical protein [Candidatus Dormibacteraeota bacterium]